MRITSWILLLTVSVAGLGCRSPATEAPGPSLATGPDLVGQGEPATQDTGSTDAAASLVDLPDSFAAATTPDKGIFSDLDGGFTLGQSPWIDRSAGLVIANRFGDAFLFVAGQAVAYAGSTPADLVVDQFAGADQDQDAIPDHFDILLGVKKVAQNGARYGSPYREIAFPGGDVPREEGVCTDVIVRAMRNAGVDLQQTLQDDIRAKPAAFKMVRTPNAHIDHRRVKTLLPHFVRRWRSLSIDPHDVVEPWLPGDVIFMQTMGDSRPDHLGIVSDDLGQSGAPMIVNNWTDGYSTAPMDVAKLVPITHRFRWPTAAALPAEHAGLTGVLKRQGLEVPAASQQVIVVTGLGWNSAAGKLQRFERRGSAFDPVGDPVGVTLGARGLGAGLGLHEAVVKAPVDKREGDLRSPAGVFALGTAFGPSKRAIPGSWPYRRVSAADRWVDDPASPVYNTWQQATGQDSWASAEVLESYELGLVVQHNPDAVPARGSAIFMHTFGANQSATLGCTAMPQKSLEELIAWLDPTKSPVLVQVADHVFPAD